MATGLVYISPAPAGTGMAADRGAPAPVRASGTALVGIARMAAESPQVRARHGLDGGSCEPKRLAPRAQLMLHFGT